MQQNQYRGLVAGVKPNRIPDGESKEGDGLLRNQVCGGLVNIGFKSLVVLPIVIRRRFVGTGRHTVFNGRDELNNLSEGWPCLETSNRFIAGGYFRSLQAPIFQHPHGRSAMTLSHQFRSECEP